MAEQTHSSEELDLEAGISRRRLTEGQPIVGEANGERVMLVEQDGQIFAVDASCTHYGGPLEQGIVADGKVRCPWHHASFDLSDGDPSGPALEPLGCHEVVEDGDTIKVGSPRPRPAPSQPKWQPQSVVIIGAGASGAACAETLRRSGYTGPIKLVVGDIDFPVDRPNLSKDFLAGEAPEEWLPVRDQAFYDEHEIDLVSVRADSIDREKREVRLANGDVLPFHALLIATGAEPNELPIEGAGAPHVHTLRSLSDARNLLEAAEEAERAVVVGASFIGLEVAASFREHDLDVTVLDPAPVPLDHVLGRELGQAVQTIHEDHGVEFSLGHKPTKIGDSWVELDDGRRIDADLVVVGIGVSPRTELAANAGLHVDDGVVVQPTLEAEDSIYAAGDIARFPRNGSTARIEHWMVAERQGQTVARNMLGADEVFDDVPFFWSRHFDDTISYVGHASEWDEVEVHGSFADRDATVVYRAGGDIEAVATIGRPEVSLLAEIAMEQGDTDRLEELVAR